MGLIRIIAVAIAFVACSHSPSTSSTTSPLTGTPGGCIDPATYGAIPNDGLDDRPAIQSAIDAAAAAGGREICLGAGVFDVTTAPIGSYNRFAALSWHAPNVILSGAGELATVLRVSGDQGGAGPIGIVSLDPGAMGAAIRDLAFDTISATNTGEQFHAIEIGSGVGDTPTGPSVTGVIVERVRFDHPVIPGQRKGDCIRLLGNSEASEVRNVRLADLDFSACARSGVSMQRNVNVLTIARSYFDADKIGGAPIDGEATGGGWDHGLVIEANHFVRVAAAGEPYAIELTSQTNYAITGNVFVGRGMFAYRTTDGAITGNSFDATDVITGGVVELQNQAERIAVTGNTIRRRGSNGNAIHLAPHSGGMPTGVAIVGNTIRNETDGACIYVHSLVDAVVAGNQCIGGSGPNSMGVYLPAISRQVEDVAIANNTFRGFTYAAIMVVPGPYPVVGVVVSGNVSMASGPMRCPNASLIPIGGLLRAANLWSVAETCSAP
jgi:hypothetical protein